MTPRLLIALTLSAAVCSAACRTVRTLKIDTNQSSSATKFLPWTGDQMDLMKASCVSNFADKLGPDPVGECECLVNAAATRWSFETFASAEEQYLVDLVGEGAARDCGDDLVAPPKGWQPPVSLRMSSDERFAPMASSFAMSPSAERLVAIWSQDEEQGSKASIFAKAYREGSGWAPLRYIDANDSPTSFSGAPGIGFVADNTALAVWQKDDGTLRSIWTTRFVDGNWENATRLEVDVTQSSEKLVFAAHAKTGQAAIAWTQTVGANREIWVRRYGNGQWQLREVVDSGTRQSFTPALHFTPEGELIVVWTEARAANAYHVVSNRLMLGEWAGPQTLASTGAEFPHSPVLASALDNSSALAWLQDARTTDPLTNEVVLTTKVLALMRTSTRVWQSQPSVLEKEKGGSGFIGDADNSLQLGFDGKSVAHAVWQRQEGTLSKLWTARATNFKWSTRELIYPNIAGLLKNPKVAFGETDLVIGFEQEEGMQRQALASAWQGAEWEKATTIEDLTDPISLAAALWHPSGKVALLWTAQPASGGSSEIFVSFYK